MKQLLEKHFGKAWLALVFAFLYMPLDEAQLYFDKEGIVDAIEVYADDPDAMDRLRPLIQEAAERPIYIVDW